MLKVLLFFVACAFHTLPIFSQILLPQIDRDKYGYIENVPDFVFILDDNLPLYNKEGKVEIIKDNKLDFLIENYNESKIYSGFRVQIYSGKDRAVANELREDFIKAHPEIVAHLIYQQPNFKLRLGDFQNRLEALRLYDNIKSEFPSAFVIQDQIVVQNN